ncbi:hypothetical protein OKW96_14455 [Sphingobacterium sp. KU25419]|nr:hypothetical protein OKW96_14455 [Sphingobacterium sp. KU25419]
MIYVFKTSVQSEKDILNLTYDLNAHCTPGKWNFDLQDCDRILRIDTQMQNAASIILLLQNKGFDCEELPY